MKKKISLWLAVMGLLALPSLSHGAEFYTMQISASSLMEMATAVTSSAERLTGSTVFGSGEKAYSFTATAAESLSNVCGALQSEKEWTTSFEFRTAAEPRLQKLTFHVCENSTQGKYFAYPDEKQPKIIDEMNFEEYHQVYHGSTGPDDCNQRDDYPDVRVCLPDGYTLHGWDGVHETNAKNGELVDRTGKPRLDPKNSSCLLVSTHLHGPGKNWMGDCNQGSSNVDFDVALYGHKSGQP